VALGVDGLAATHLREVLERAEIGQLWGHILLARILGLSLILRIAHWEPELLASTSEPMPD
jgi:hypothetical protein